MISSKNGCTTMTVRKERRTFLEGQLESMGLFLLQLVQKMAEKLQHDITASNNSNRKPLTLQDRLIFMKDNSEYYNLFYNSITSKYKHVDRILQLLANSVVDLLEISKVVEKTSAGYLSDPIHQLYLFTLVTIFSDASVYIDAENTCILIKTMEFRRALKTSFISHSLVMTFPSTTSDFLNEEHCENPQQQQPRQQQQQQQQQKQDDDMLRVFIK